jgi:hypothetical protein
MVTKSSERKKTLIVLVGVLFIFLVITISYLIPRSTIYNLDFWYHISLGQQLQWDSPKTLSNGLYPLGYPLLLSLSATAGLDVLRYGQFLSLSGGILLLLTAFLIIHNLTRSIGFSVVGTFLLLLNLNFLTYATFEGNDMLAAGLQTSAITALWFGTNDDGSSFSKPLLLFHGVLLGLAYLVRYTALLLVPISLLYLVIVYRRSANKLFWAITFALLPFFLTTLVQLIPSWQAHNNLFYNEQAKNVWFGIYGEQDWVNNWGKVPDNISLLEVFKINPIQFLQHWRDQTYLAFTSARMWPQIFRYFWIVAIVVFAFSNQPKFAKRLLLLLVSLVPIIATALAWTAPRFLLIPLWTQAVFISWLAFRLTNYIPLSRQSSVAIMSVGLFIIAVALQSKSVLAWYTEPPLTRAQEVNSFLRNAGMTSSTQVATNDPYLHVTDEPARSRFAQTYLFNPTPDSLEELLEIPAAENWQYLVLDYVNGFGEYKSIRNNVIQEKSRIVPLSLTEDRDIYCLTPCFADKSIPVDISFGNGLNLISYHYIGKNEQGAIFLYWQTENKLEKSFKFSIRVKDPAGLDVVQIDAIPQLWTMPTTAWQPKELVVDFYSWDYGEPCIGCTIYVVVYDEDSLEPLTGLDENRQQFGPLIPLYTITN